MTPEFSRRYTLDSIGGAPRTVEIEADDVERVALARRFDLIALDALRAKATVTAIAGGVEARGIVKASVIQACVVSGDPVSATIDEPFALRFIADLPVDAADEEEGMELSDADCDVVPLEDGSIDLGEAAAQTLSLALDPFPRSPAKQAREDERKWVVGDDAGPFAGLKGLLGGG